MKGEAVRRENGRDGWAEWESVGDKGGLGTSVYKARRVSSPVVSMSASPSAEGRGQASYVR